MRTVGPEHARLRARAYPYLLRKLAIERANHVWCADVTYVPMRRGFLYLVAIMDWATRKVLAWRLSNTMDAGFCVAALEEALTRFGKRDCQEFRVWAGIMGKKESHYVPTQRACDP